MMIGLRSDAEATLFLRWSVEPPGEEAPLRPGMFIVYPAGGKRHLYRGVTLAGRRVRSNRNLTPIPRMRFVNMFGRLKPQSPTMRGEECVTRHGARRALAGGCGETAPNVTVSAVSSAGYLRDPPRHVWTTASAAPPRAAEAFSNT
ncbi:hypothetical protein GCM10017752_48300 [Streptomyces roseoviridis]